MAILLDVLVLVLLWVFIADGYRRGVVKSLLSCAGATISLAASSYISNTLARNIYYNFVDPIIVEKISGAFISSAGQDIGSQISLAFSSLPAYMVNTLKFYDITQPRLLEIINETSTNIPRDIANLVSPIAINGIRTLLLMTIFASLMAFVRVITRNINKLFRLPILKQVNQLLGAVFGAVKCAIILVLLVFIMRAFVPMIAGDSSIFSNETIESTLIFRHIYYCDPFIVL